MGCVCVEGEESCRGLMYVCVCGGGGGGSCRGLMYVCV